MFASSTSAVKAGTANKLDPQDVEVTIKLSTLFDAIVKVASPPTDGITGIDFSSQADFMAVSSWDKQVRIYEVQGNGTTVPKASYSHENPVLCVSWTLDGTKVVSGGTDKAGRMFDSATGQSTQIAQHDEPIRCIKHVTPPSMSNSTIIATGSWDKTVKYWDTRSPQPIGTIDLPERCYAMDTKGNLLVIGTADKHVVIVDLNNPTVKFKTIQSPTKWQTRDIACFPDGKGFAVSSIEGRVAIQYVEGGDAHKNFSFKCHRDPNNNLYSVNSLNFHPVYGTFSTAGSDGEVCFWDKDSKQRLKPFQNNKMEIPCTAFNRDGKIFAYALSYDWSKGYKFANPTNKIFLHAVKEIDIKPKPKKR